ncbi:transcription initiation factor TFIID subunit 4B, partial [Sigmodon hispidus]
MLVSLTKPAGTTAPVVTSASRAMTMAPATALGPVTKAPVSVCMESVAPQPVPSPVGTLMAKVVPVTALPKLGGPRLPAPQIVTVKIPYTRTIQLPANLQLPPGTVLIKNNS